MRANDGSCTWLARSTLSLQFLFFLLRLHHAAHAFWLVSLASQAARESYDSGRLWVLMHVSFLSFRGCRLWGLGQLDGRGMVLVLKEAAFRGTTTHRCVVDRWPGSIVRSMASLIVLCVSFLPIARFLRNVTQRFLCHSVPSCPPFVAICSRSLPPTIAHASLLPPSPPLPPSTPSAPFLPAQLTRRLASSKPKQLVFPLQRLDTCNVSQSLPYPAALSAPSIAFLPASNNTKGARFSARLSPRDSLRRRRAGDCDRSAADATSAADRETREKGFRRTRGPSGSSLCRCADASGEALGG